MSDNENIKDSLIGLGGALIILLLVVLFLCSSCKLFKESQSSTVKSDSTNTKSESNFHKDSLGSKSDKTSVKETVYYPQPIIVPGKDGETKVVFVPQSTKETGTEKTEQTQVIVDTSWGAELRQILNLQKEKYTEIKAKVGPSLIEWILIIAVVLLFLPKIFQFITKIKLT